jgi:uncharacterized protein (TIGR02328 family)
MRLWHYELIPVLPHQQLLAQWRELCCIIKNIENKGTPNHLLVNKVLTYPMSHLYSYGFYVKQEMNKRGYNCNFGKFSQYFEKGDCVIVPLQDIFSNWHTNRYLIQCYFNLQEKHDCNGISDDEWQRVQEYVTSKSPIDF